MRYLFMDITTQTSHYLKPQYAQTNTQQASQTRAGFEQPQSDHGHALHERAVEKAPETAAASTAKPQDDPSQETNKQATDTDAQTAIKKTPEEAAAQQQASADLQQIRELSARDREVRAHEQAHAAVGGAHAGSPSYEYQNGPDGKQYAVGGEVSISTSVISNDPHATLDKAQTIRRAALAPAEPSSQDRAVAAQSSQMIAQAMADISALQQEELKRNDEEGLSLRVNGERTSETVNTSPTTANTSAQPASTAEHIQYRQHIQSPQPNQQSQGPLTQSGEIETPSIMLGSRINGYA